MKKRDPAAAAVELELDPASLIGTVDLSTCLAAALLDDERTRVAFLAEFRRRGYVLALDGRPPWWDCFLLNLRRTGTATEAARAAGVTRAAAYKWRKNPGLADEWAAALEEHGDRETEPASFPPPGGR